MTNKGGEAAADLDRRASRCGFTTMAATKMVRLERESLNSLFETLEEWERHLAQLDPKGLRCGHDKPPSP